MNCFRCSGRDYVCGNYVNGHKYHLCMYKVTANSDLHKLEVNNPYITLTEQLRVFLKDDFEMSSKLEKLLKRLK